jgi:hypothetical protein
MKCLYVVHDHDGFCTDDTRPREVVINDVYKVIAPSKEIAEAALRHKYQPSADRILPGGFKLEYVGVEQCPLIVLIPPF